jgi:predicted RNase H-like HicB family nuclease
MHDKFSQDFTPEEGAPMKLRVILEQDEAGYYVAEVPALPGCLSQGKTSEEAIANIKEAIEGWLEVMESKQSFDPARVVEVAV